MSEELTIDLSGPTHEVADCLMGADSQNSACKLCIMPRTSLVPLIVSPRLESFRDDGAGRFEATIKCRLDKEAARLVVD